uniref:Polyketide synthase n=1 Tax=uncultured bacterium AB_1383 TaxID=1630010 RepID=A0A0E3JRL8_9BACT|nr:polyketide synthase [uncultured bacterium AB_1383]
MANTESIAIVGMACRFPGARNVDEYWANLRAGRDSIRRFGREELLAAGVDPALVDDPDYVPARGVVEGAERFDWKFFGYSPGEAATIDPQQRVFLESASAALDDAGIDPARFPGWVGVFAGCDLPPRPEAVDGDEAMRFVLGLEKDFLATRAAYKLGLRGPAVTVQTACSTSLVAVHQACQSLYGFECDVALAGGVSVWTPQAQGYLFREGSILSPDGRCRPFDAAAAGTVPASGVGVVVLKRLSDALEAGDRIVALIRGSAVNNDGSEKIGFTAPSVTGQRDVIRLAMAQAGVTPDQVGYVEAHGTGTRVGDPVEVAALSAAFGDPASRREPCLLGAVKSTIGHTGAAAGVAGLIKTACMLRHRELAPTANFAGPNPLIRFEETPFRVCTRMGSWDAPGPLFAGVSSFGMGGTNAHAVLESPPSAEPREADRPRPRVFCLSTAGAAAMEPLRAELAARMEGEAAPPPADAAWTLAAGRRRFPHRLAVVASGAEELARRLREPAAPVHAEAFPPVAFLFPGQGTLHPGAGAAAYRLLPRFRETFEEARAVLRERCGVDLDPLLDPAADPAWALDTEHQQLGLFVLGYGLAAQLRAWGIAPAAMLGHSIGEYVAAALAGVWTLPDALLLVRERGRAMRETAPGKMLSVAAPAARLADLDDGALALAVEGPAGVVLSGGPEAVEARRAAVEARGIPCRLLATERAFHSPLMRPAAEALRRAAAAVPAREPAARFVSNLTGGWADPDEVRSPEYWAAHLCGTVRLSAGLDTLLAEPGWLFLELGPGESMLRAVRAHPGWDGDTARLVSTLGRSAGSEEERLLRAMGALWEHGAELDWAELFDGTERRCSLLPHPMEPRPCELPRAPAARRADTGSAVAASGPLHADRWRQADEGEAGGHGGLLLVGAEPGPGLRPLLERLGGRPGGAEAAPLPPDPRRVEAALDGLAGEDPAVVLLLPDGSGAEAADALDALAERTAGRGAALYVVGRGAAEVLGGDAASPAGAALLAWFAHRRRSGAPGSVVLLDVGFSDTPDRLPAWEGAAAVCAWRGSRWWTLAPDPVRTGPAPEPDPVALVTWGREAGAELADALAAGGWRVAAHAALDEPAPRVGPGEVAAGLEAPPAAPGLSRRPDLAAALDGYAAALVARFVLARAGAAPGERIPREALLRRVSPRGALPRFADFLVDTLASAGWLEPDGDGVRITATAEGAEEAVRSHEARLGELPGLCELLREYAEAYPAVLDGEREGVSVLFPDGSDAMLRSRMERNGVRLGDAEACLDALVGAVRALARRRRPLRILEVGGGQGTVFSRLFEGWDDAGGVSYHFTDVSPLFVRRARERLAPDGRPGLRFDTLDITRDPVEQGFAAGSYDLVVGYNVLHVAPSVPESVRLLDRLLARDGWLCLVELTRPAPWVHMVWGLAPGWWDYDDGLRRDSPHLDAAAWERVLRGAGLEEVAAVAPGGAADHALLLAARPADAAADPVLRAAGELRRQAPAEGCRDLLFVPRLAADGDGDEAAGRLAALLEASPWPGLRQALVVTEDAAVEPGWRGQLRRRALDAPPRAGLPRWRHLEAARLGAGELALLPAVLAARRIPAAMRLDPVDPPAPPLEAAPPPDLPAAPQAGAADVPTAADPLRAALHAAWCEVLGVTSAADADDFFDAGGDSLIAIGLVGRVQERTRCRVPVAAFLRSPTFGGLVELARRELPEGNAAAPAAPAPRPAEAPAPPDELVELRQGGERVPLFLAAPAAGSSLCYRHLAGHLDPEQPCYGLDTPGLHGGADPPRRIEEIAAHHVRLIRRARPRGPYLLGGWSTGALVAHEVARQLAAAGETVARLVLIDGYAPDSGGRALATRPEYLLAGASHWLRGRLGMLRAGLFPEAGGAAGKPARAGGRGERMAGILELARGAPGFAAVYQATIVAMLRYRPAPAPCPATLLRAGLDPAGRARLERRLAPLYGGAVEVLPAPGTHWSMLGEPHVRGLAREVAALLARAAAPAEMERACAD